MHAARAWCDNFWQVVTAQHPSLNKPGVPLDPITMKQNSSPGADAAGQNPGNATSPLIGATGLSALAEAVTQLETPAAPESSAPTPPPAEGDPEVPADSPTPPETPGENLSPEETKPQPGSDEPGSATETDLSQPEPAGDDLAGLDADTKARVLEIAKALKAGDLKPGELPKIAKLVGQKHEQTEQLTQKIETLEKQIEELRQAPPVASETATPLPIHPKVAALKNEAEIERKEAELTNLIRDCEDFPDGVPADRTPNGREISAEQVKQTKRDAEDQLKALPKQQRVLQQRAQLQQAQRAHREQVLKDFPVLNDPQNPTTQLARKLMADPQIARQPNADYLALALATGHQALEAEKAKRNQPAATPAVRPVVRRPAASNGSGAPPRPAATNGASVSAAKERIGKERSVGALAALVEAGNA